MFCCKQLTNRLFFQNLLEQIILNSETECITVANVASTMITMMVNNPLVEVMDLTSLRLLSCGGSPQSRSIVMRAIALFGCEFFLSYGMTECCGKISMSILPSDKEKMAPEEQLDLVCTSGRPFCLIDVRVVDDQGHDVPKDGKTVGEVVIAGPTVFQGYTGLDEANKEAFDGCWFHTGDLAVSRPDGYISVVDRKKDMLLVGGENVYTTEVEDVLHSHPAVHLAAVFGVANKVMGELVMAAVTLKPEFQRQNLGKELVQWCRNNLAEYKVPVAVHTVKSFPTTGSGKIMKTKLREMFSGETQQTKLESETQVVAPADSQSLARYISDLSGGNLNCFDLSKPAIEYSAGIIDGSAYIYVTNSLSSSMDAIRNLAACHFKHLVFVSTEKPDKEAVNMISSALQNKEVVLLYLPSSTYECRNDKLVRTALSAARAKVPPFGGIFYCSKFDTLPEGQEQGAGSLDIKATVLAILGGSLDSNSVNDISNGEPFMASGVNSTMAVQFVTALEESLGINIPGTIMFDYPTLGDMVGYLSGEFGQTETRRTIESRTQVRKVHAPLINNEKSPNAVQDISKLRQKVLKLVSDAIGHDNPDVDAPLMSLGVNSTLAVQLVTGLEAIAGEELPGTLVFDYPSINEIAKFIGNFSLPGDIHPAPETQVEHAGILGTCAIKAISGSVPGGHLEYSHTNGNDRISKVPLERWDVDQPPYDNENELNLQFGSFINGADQFDARLFNLSPAEALLMDPQQRLLLNYFLSSWRSHSDYGLSRRDVGIFVGVSQLDYARIAYETGSALNTYYATGSHLSVTSGRISYSFGFKGPAITVDTACSSSLVSTHLAANSIHEHSCETAATLGVNLALVHSWTRACLRAGMLADDGRCKTLDSSAGVIIDCQCTFHLTPCSLL